MDKRSFKFKKMELCNLKKKRKKNDADINDDIFNLEHLVKREIGEDNSLIYDRHPGTWLLKNIEDIKIIYKNLMYELDKKKTNLLRYLEFEDFCKFCMYNSSMMIPLRSSD